MKKSKKRITALIISLTFFMAACTQPEKTTEENGEQQPPKPKQVVQNDLTPVEAMVVYAKTLQQNITLSGVVQPIHEVDIVAEVSGKIQKINKKLGEAVTVKDILAVIDDKIPLGQYRQAKSQVLSAENNLKIARLNLKSDKELFENGDISKLEYENSKLAVKTAEANHLSALANLSILEKSYEDTRIKSPVKGFISRKYIDLGTMVTQNMPVYRVVDITTLKIEAGIPQSAVSRIHEGSAAVITISALNNQTFNGQVRFISPQADENSGTFNTEIHVDNTEDLTIRAGMTAKIDLIMSDKRKLLVVPDYAVVKKNGQSYVYKITDDIAKLTAISIGETIGSTVIISEGLNEGDRIVVVGMKNLGAETKVRIEDTK